MKIIGLGENKYICEVSDEEIWEIIEHDDNDEDWSLEAGEEINLVRVIRAAKWIRTLDEEHINRVMRELTTTLHGMEKVKDTVQALTLFNKIRESDTHETI